MVMLSLILDRNPSLAEVDPNLFTVPGGNHLAVASYNIPYCYYVIHMSLIRMFIDNLLDQSVCGSTTEYVKSKNYHCP